MSLPLALQPFVTLSYWFTAVPPPFSGLALYLLEGSVVAIIVVGFIIRLWHTRAAEPSTRKALRRISSWLMTMGVLVGLNVLLTQGEIPTLGSRFWFLVWLVLGAAWLVSILRYVFGAAPHERAEHARQTELAKYLPRAH